MSGRLRPRLSVPVRPRSFRAPPPRPGTDRAVFLHSRGYYKLHLTGTGEPDTKMLDAIENVPGTGARFAADKFGQWQIAKR